MLAYPVADTLGNDLGERCAGAHTKKRNKVLYVSAVTLSDQKESFSGESEEQPGLADGRQRDAKVADGPRLWDPGDTGNWP